MSEVTLNSSWKTHLSYEFSKDYMCNLKKFLQDEKLKGKLIFPKREEYFRALNLTSFEKVKVVIIGQDPYHGPGQAHGLSFSVRKDVPIPRSLCNIFKELKADLGIKIPNHGFLESWANQGVLLLNSILTVECKKPGSHQGCGWEQFTDKIIFELNKQCHHLVFILWGSYAQKKGRIIDIDRHKVICSPHPSPLSAHRGFFGSNPFSIANNYLTSHNIVQIDWNLT